MPSSMRQTIDQLLTVDEADSKTDFMRFAKYPPEARAKHIVQYLDRFHIVAKLNKAIEEVRAGEHRQMRGI
jgi:hypothetical protein